MKCLYPNTKDAREMNRLLKACVTAREALDAAVRKSHAFAVGLELKRRDRKSAIRHQRSEARSPRRAPTATPPTEPCSRLTS
jgi:hypothetical protein